MLFCPEIECTSPILKFAFSNAPFFTTLHSALNVWRYGTNIKTRKLNHFKTFREKGKFF